MKLLELPGGNVWTTVAPDWEATAKSSVSVGMMTSSIHNRMRRGQRALLGQLYGVVCPGLILTAHVFQGLMRPMFVSGNNLADEEKYAFSWAAKKDAILVGDRFDPSLEQMDAPSDRVFVVYISPNKMLDKFPNMWGWIEHWAWVPADPNLSGAPIDWETRYDRKCWSRNG